MTKRTSFRQMVTVLAALCLAACAQSPSETAQNVAAIPLLNAQNLVGSTPAALDAAFGQPTLRRVDGAAQVWLYHSAVCGLNLILYPDPSGTPRVATAVPDNGDATSCTESLQRAGLTAASLEPPAAS